MKMNMKEMKHMRIDVIKKLSKISLLALISGGLVACNNDKEEKETDLFTLVSSLKENSNYTRHIEDDLGSLNQWFMPKFYAYNFGDSSKDIYTAYISIQEASVKLLTTRYPQYYHPSRSLMEDWIRKFKEEENKYKEELKSYNALSKAEKKKTSPPKSREMTIYPHKESDIRSFL